MSESNNQHHVQIAFKNKHGKALANTKYELRKKDGSKVAGVTDSQGKTEILKSDKHESIWVWVQHIFDDLRPAGQAEMRPVSQKPEIEARCKDEPKCVKGNTKEHGKKQVEKVEVRKYSVQFKVSGFGCSGQVSYRMVQDGKVLIEGKTKGETVRIYTDSESEVLLYIAGDKRYKTGETYKEEVNDGDVAIPAWVQAKPNTNPGHVENQQPFDKRDWVDVSKIYDQNHPDIISESRGIYAGSWTPPPEPRQKHRRYVVQVDGRDVVLFWTDDACDNGLSTNGRRTSTARNTFGWYMKVEQVISRTHPKVFKVLFDIIKTLNLTKVDISSSWRPGKGSSAHREGRALDITHIEAGRQRADARDNLPGTATVDNTDTPSTTEPELIKKLRLALHDHPDVEAIFEPWYGMFSPHGSFEDSYASVRPVPTSPNLLESQAAFKNA